MYRIVSEGTGAEIRANMTLETETSIRYSVMRKGDKPYTPDKYPVWNTNSTGRIPTLTKENCVGEILQKIKKGGKVIVAMPSKLFWEDKDLPVNEYEQYYIPKWSVVFFTITVKE
jgi:hypothetical protein